MTPRTMQGAVMMERLRLDLIRRATSERNGDLEQPTDNSSRNAERELERDLESNRPQPTRAPASVLTLPNFFGRREPPLTERSGDAGESETPKSPEFGPRMARPGRFNLPSFGQILSRGPPTEPLTAEPHDPTLPPPTRPREPGRTNTTRLDTPDPADVHPAQLAEHDHRRRRDRPTGRAPNEGRSRKKPKHFLGCLPWVPSRRTRTLILRCLVSGLFFGILLAVYLGLSASKTLNTGEQTIMLMLIILLATAFFCYSLLRLCLIVVRGRRSAPSQEPRSGPSGGSGYAIPSQPIRVVLARDEEAAGTESEAQKTTPPAYGMWRQSVRVDPDRLFWQRNDSANIIPRLPEDIVGSRPPSYASEDGVSYVVDAAPRSTVPTTVETAAPEPMPLHPSEVGRTTQRPTR